MCSAICPPRLAFQGFCCVSSVENRTAGPDNSRFEWSTRLGHVELVRCGRAIFVRGWSRSCPLPSGTLPPEMHQTFVSLSKTCCCLHGRYAFQEKTGNLPSRRSLCGKPLAGNVKRLNSMLVLAKRTAGGLCSAMSGKLAQSRSDLSFLIFWVDYWHERLNGKKGC